MKNKRSDEEVLFKTVAGSAAIYALRKFSQEPFVVGETYIPPAKKMAGPREMENLVKAALEGGWTEGHWTDEFERAFADKFSRRCASFVNSGSSANLLAMAALKEFHDIPDGSYVLTTAVGFPTTINPILQVGLRPYFIDVELGTYVPSFEMITEGMLRSQAKAIMMAHTLGNPWPAHRVLGLPMIEDNCDALGSILWGKMTGQYGDLATHSFYPAHHITTGEGGMITTDRPRLQKIVESFRDWGRDCWCAPGDENTCGKRFDWDFDGLPEGYDHKYIYSRIGWNLKSTDLQAAIGVAQLKRVNEFGLKRRANFAYFKQELADMEEFFILPEAAPDADPSWFGFPLTIRETAPFTAAQITRDLAKMKVGTRRLFAGNALRQPAYHNIDYGASEIKNADIVAESTFWFGVHPGIDEPRRAYIAEVMNALLAYYRHGKGLKL